MFKKDQNVTLTCETDSAIIYYTTDNTIPTHSSSIYSKPILISGHNTQKTLLAIAGKYDMSDSQIAESNYKIYYDKLPIP